MARPQLLLVDADPRSVRVLEATLKNEGFSVTAAADGAEALEKLEVGLPDVLITETRLPRLNGFELVNQLRQLPGGAHVPVVFVGLADEPQRLQFGEKSDLVRAAELGVEHCLFKPLLVRELVVRIRLLLARRQQNLIASRSDDLSLERFSGRLQDTGMVDILLSLDSSRRSGCLRVVQGPRVAVLFFRNGKVVDAEQGRVQGEEAVYRTFLWTTGLFEFESRTVEHRDLIPTGTQGLLMEGMRRIEEWGRLAEQLPSSAAVFEVDAEAFLERLPEIPDELNAVIRLIDGSKTLIEIIDVSPFDDLSTLSVISKLYFDGVLRLIADQSEAQALLPVATTSANDRALTTQGQASVRPTAPRLSVENTPRRLVYSEPPQSQRWSQQHAHSSDHKRAFNGRADVQGADFPDLGQAVRSADAHQTAVAESAASSAAAVSPRPSEDDSSAAASRVSSRTAASANSKASEAEPLAAAGPEENGRRGNEVDEAEFEDFAAASEERAEVSVQTPRVQARTILGLGAVGANIKRANEEQQSPERASAAERASAEPANGDDKGVLNTRPPPLTQPSARGGENTSNAGTQAVLSNAAGSRADDVPAPEAAPTATPGTTAQGTKGPAEPLEQTFFAEGEQGIYEGGPASVEPVAAEPAVHEDEDEPADPVDPAILAMLGERRKKSRLWVTRIVGVAVLLSLWGLFLLWRGEPAETRSRESGTSGLDESQQSLSRPNAPLPSDPTSVQDPVEPEPVLDDSSLATTEKTSAGELESDVTLSPRARQPAAPGLVAPSRQSSVRSSGDRKTDDKNRKPPTARFPSTTQTK